jgi:hypothetical protein
MLRLILLRSKSPLRESSNEGESYERVSNFHFFFAPDLTALFGFGETVGFGVLVGFTVGTGVGTFTLLPPEFELDEFVVVVT